MAKYNIDDILNELGVDKPAKALPSRGEDAPSRTQPKRVSVDDLGSMPASVRAAGPDAQELAMSPIPAVPANQRTYGELVKLREGSDSGELPANDDPAVKQILPAAPRSSVGSAMSDLYRPEQVAGALAKGGGADLAEYLLSRGLVPADRMTVAQGVLKQSPGRRLADILIEQGVDEVIIQRAVAELAGIPFERIDLSKGLDGGFDGKLLQSLTPDFCKKNGVIPLRMDGARVVLGVTRPDDVFLLDEIRGRLRATGIKVVMVTGFDLRGAMEIVGAGREEASVDVSELLAEVSEGDVQVEKRESNEVNLEKEAAESPVIRYVNYIIQTAVKEGASDIHVEPAEKKLRVRFRIDGELFEMMNPPGAMSAAITSRLKIMANLDISERRLPQDGRIRCVVQGRKLDLRVSTLPTGYGEKTVMRILDTKSINVELDNLGFHADTLEVWRKIIDLPHGIVLVTGPTGSGKTTTLYSSLRQLDKNTMNISTVEDPIEYHLDGVTQTQMHEKIGMTFAAALKSLLRQDPDVIMLGEIRDMETAHIAVQAALTGHLVLSTLHTNDAPASITRLVNIGLEPFLVGAAVNGVLAQRLIRRLCTHCKVEETPSADMVEYLTMQGLPTDKMWAAKGCERCRNTGYSGRVGIYELLTVDDQLRDVIARNPNVSEFRRMCLERGMVSLRMDGVRKVAQGLTTVSEVLRVTEANA